MFAYCGNNPVLNFDSSGEFFFTAVGALTGFISGGITAMLSQQPKEEWFETAVHGAVGGAIAGAGVDLGVLLIGTAGLAAPAVAGAVALAYVMGGLGNVYTTYATSKGQADDSHLLGSFLIGGTFNTISFATGLSAASSTVSGLMYNGMSDLGENIAVGTGIGLATGIATGIGTQESSAATKTRPSRRVPFASSTRNMFANRSVMY